MKVWDITTTEQDIEEQGLQEFVNENPEFSIQYGEGGTPATHYPTLCEDTEDTEPTEYTFSIDGTLQADIIAGTTPPPRPK